MNPSYLLISDFDNTQAPTKKQKLQPSTALPYTFILKQMAEKGDIPLIHCTGRSPVHLIRDMVNAQYSSLPAPHAAKTEMILTNVGTQAFIWDKKQKIYHEIDGPIHSEAKLYFEKNYARLTAAIKQSPNLIIQPDKYLGPYKISAWQGDNNKNHETIYDELRTSLHAQGLSENDMEITISTQGRLTIDLTPKGATKGNALRFAAAHYNMPLKEIFYAGDSMNDLDAMLVEDINVILPSNAQASLIEQVKKQVDHKRVFHTLHPYAMGILSALVQAGKLPEMPIAPSDLSHLSSWHPVTRPPTTISMTQMDRAP